MLIKSLKRAIKDRPIGLETIQITVMEYIRFFYSDIEIPSCLDILSHKSDEGYKLTLKEIFENTPMAETQYLPGEIYKNLIPTNLKKKLGQVFTPTEIIKEIIANTPIKSMYLSNPYMRVFDPACGSGDFLIEVYKTILEIIDNNRDCFEEEFGIDTGSIESHIMKNNLYGCEIDDFTAFLASSNLRIISDCSDAPDIKAVDYLFSDTNHSYDLIIGNPPYIGHKNLQSSYKKALKEKYLVYSDKADISYCFFEKCFSDLKALGLLSFITSRYFIEAEHAKALREFIINHYTVIGIIDYGGLNLFKNTGISPVIITLSKGSEQKDITVVDLNKQKNYKIASNDLNGAVWDINDNQSKAIMQKINNKSDSSVDEVFDIYQGIITGCDEAFIVDDDIIRLHGIESELLVNWIKSSHLKGDDGISDSKSLKLIYTNHQELGKMPNTKKYLENFKERLKKRRECITGVRRWYDLQWCRKKDLFERDKILFPYKASQNHFTLDIRNYYFSADIYMMIPKDNALNLRKTLYYLNSEVFEFMIKSKAKKMGSSLFEYYPYTIKKMPFVYIPENIVESIMEYDKIMIQVNQYLYDYFNISQFERMIISERIK
ncbi:MAG: N-6 DNA methylase [Eubacteriales bacterium]|nr:N-6 DNA methylase [Eubacteriales bacterium]